MLALSATPTAQWSTLHAMRSGNNVRVLAKVLENLTLLQTAAPELPDTCCTNFQCMTNSMSSAPSALQHDLGDIRQHICVIHFPLAKYPRYSTHTAVLLPPQPFTNCLATYAAKGWQEQPPLKDDWTRPRSSGEIFPHDLPQDDQILPACSAAEY